MGACNVDAGQLTAAFDAAERLGISGYQVVQNGYSLLGPQHDRAVRSICVQSAVICSAVIQSCASSRT